MAHTMFLPNGAKEIMFGPEDFKRLVEQHIGFEAGEYVAELIRKSDAAAHQAESDFRAYELQVEEQQSALQNIQELAEALLNTKLNKAQREKAEHIIVLCENHV